MQSGSPFNIDFLNCRKVIGLHCTLNSLNEPEFTAVILFRRKGILQIESCLCFRCDFSRLNENLPSGLPILLSIDGKGILQKKVNSDDEKEILKMLMPGGSKEDFIIDSCPGAGNEFYVSLARRDFVDGIIEKLNNPGLYIIDFTINPLEVARLTCIFDDLPSFFISGCYEIQTIERGFVSGVSKKDFPGSEDVYSFDGYEVNSRYLLPFWNAIKFFSGEKKEDVPAGIKYQRSEFYSKRLFALGSFCSLGLIFIILLLNFSLFAKLSGKKEQLDLTLTSNKELIAKIGKLKEEVSWKEKFLSRSGINQNRWFSYISDDIGASIPDDISLEKIELHPLGSKIVSSKEIVFQPGILRVNGTANTSSALNDWVRKLKELNWTLDVTVQNFLQKENSDAGDFAVEIIINESAH